jgi:hypothetical protein
MVTVTMGSSAWPRFALPGRKLPERKLPGRKAR